MKPLNLDNKPCSPISSNCVVWQGPDIPCIHLCTGDSISDVVHKLATELCEVLETLKVSNYDLTCFSTISCGPQNFQELVQFILDQLCLLEGGTPSSSGGTVVPIRPIFDVRDPIQIGSSLVTIKPTFTKARASETCPDCVVTVPDEFVVGTQRTMQLVDYAVTMGERIASIVGEVSLINDQITDMTIRVRDLENKPDPVFPALTVQSKCDIGTIPASTDSSVQVIVEQFFNALWCDFYATTGTVVALSNAISDQSIANTDLTLANPTSNYETEYSTWVTTPVTVADSLRNIWLSVYDIYASLPATQVTVEDTNTVELSLTTGLELTAKVKDTGWIDLNGFDFYSGTATKPQVRRVGNVLHFRGTVFVPLDNGAGGIHGLSSYTDYNNIPTCIPGTAGTGAVSLSTGGVISFNSGTSVIPASITSKNLDADYKMPYPNVLSRPMVISGTAGTSLTAASRLGITEAGVLYIASLRDQEQTGTTTGVIGGSHLRFITSNVRSGESVPNYINTDTDIHNFPAAGANPLIAETDFGGSDYTWPFSCDAGDSGNLGGFFASIDGLTAFLDCSADITATTCY